MKTRTIVLLATNHDVVTRSWQAANVDQAVAMVNWLGDNGITAEAVTKAAVDRLKAKEVA